MLWHKCKNGTMVNLDNVTELHIYPSATDSFYICALFYNSQHRLLEGTREECEAEMREIEEKVMGVKEKMVLAELAELARVKYGPGEKP